MTFSRSTSSNLLDVCLIRSLEIRFTTSSKFIWSMICCARRQSPGSPSDTTVMWIRSFHKVGFIFLPHDARDHMPPMAVDQRPAITWPAGSPSHRLSAYSPHSVACLSLARPPSIPAQSECFGLRDHREGYSRILESAVFSRASVALQWGQLTLYIKPPSTVMQAELSCIPR